MWRSQNKYLQHGYMLVMSKGTLHVEKSEEEEDIVWTFVWRGCVETHSEE